MPKLMGENSLFSDREADMKWFRSPGDPPQGLLWIRPLVTHREVDLEVLKNQCCEHEEFWSGKSLSHAYPFSHPIGHKLLPALSVQESIGVEDLWLFPIVGVKVKCYDVVEYNAILRNFVPIKMAILLCKVRQRGGSDAAKPLNFH